MIQIYDNVLFYAEQVQTHATCVKANEHGVAPVEGNDWFVNTLQTTTQLPIKVSSSRFEKATPRPDYIANCDTPSQYTAILFLNNIYPEEAGISFWRSRAYDACSSSKFIMDKEPLLSDWTLVKKVPMRFNRAVVFDSRLFISSSTFPGNLIQVVEFSL